MKFNVQFSSCKKDEEIKRILYGHCKMNVRVQVGWGNKNEMFLVQFHEEEKI